MRPFCKKSFNYNKLLECYSNVTPVSRVDSVITNSGYQQSSLAEKEVIAR